MLYQINRRRLNHVINWFDQVAVLRGLDGLHILTSSVILGLGGTGGGPSMGGHVQIAGVQCSICDVWGVASCAMYLAISSARTKASPLVRLEFLGGDLYRRGHCSSFSLGLLGLSCLEQILV